ncbi:hypothetical protein NEOC65_001700 [Neochlamydia sp. AcF65]|nr:hypothetical protein [Neochlamydia sp. AcF65]
MQNLLVLERQAENLKEDLLKHVSKSIEDYFEGGDKEQ